MAEQAGAPGPRRVQMALPGMAPFGVFASDVYPSRCHDRPRVRAKPHGSRPTKLEAPAAIPIHPADEKRQLTLWMFWAWENYPERRPRTYGYCQALGLGDRMPCAFATCKHSLLSDEYRRGDRNGEMHDEDVDLWAIETCSLAVAARGKHGTLEVVAISGHCETTVEEWSRRGLRKYKAALGIEDATWPPKYKGYKIQSTETDGLDKLVAKMPERPNIKSPPVKVLTREQVAALYGADSVHARYGEARAIRERDQVPQRGRRPAR
jgi:hypothetical protein